MVVWSMTEKLLPSAGMVAIVGGEELDK